jgi:predicted anti-sigma-YlaC factor YlaD
MNFSLALSGSTAGNFLLAALILIALKLISAVVQTALMRGDYRNTPKTAFFRTVYITGKVAPFLALACVAIPAILNHDRAAGWLYGVLAVFIALLAAYVVRLRKRGRFFGLLDVVTRKKE